MKTIKKTADYTIFQKRNERYAVKGADSKWINGEEKAKILLAEELIKLSVAAPAEEPVEEVAEEATEEAVAEEEATEEDAKE
ncbi:hypothetical protein KFE80_13270 [bacterium SCSIO 12696]|nr:hypothetical protein KFE80_13270 [bacterium SCSIO 12696]